MEEFLACDSALDLKGKKEDFLNPFLSLSLQATLKVAMQSACNETPGRISDDLQYPWVFNCSANLPRVIQTKTEVLTGRRWEGNEVTAQMWLAHLQVIIGNLSSCSLFLGLAGFWLPKWKQKVLNIVERFVSQVSAHLQLDGHYLLSKHCS